MKTILLSIALALLPSGNSFAIEKFTITFLLVPEKEACRQYGYSDYRMGEAKSNCEPITSEYFENLKNIYSIELKQRSETNTKTTILRPIKPSRPWYPKYENARTMLTANERSSMLIEFDLGNDANGKTILIKRAASTNSGIPGMEKAYTVQGRRVFHHERADAFIPTRNTTWTISIDDSNWNLKMGQGGNQ